VVKERVIILEGLEEEENDSSLEEPQRNRWIIVYRSLVEEENDLIYRNLVAEKMDSSRCQMEKVNGRDFGSLVEEEEGEDSSL